MTHRAEARAAPGGEHEASTSRRGRFCVSGVLVRMEPHPPGLLAAFGEVVPVAIEYDATTDVFWYTAISARFDSIPEGALPPCYTVTVNADCDADGQQSVNGVDFERDAYH